ncbi:MAG: hypothetical protein JW981_11325, partial [Anaerolineae bacterium]|nr:hypothetical protein [Anaerolineae bacterium]
CTFLSARDFLITQHLIFVIVGVARHMVTPMKIGALHFLKCVAPDFRYRRCSWLHSWYYANC